MILLARELKSVHRCRFHLKHYRMKYLLFLLFAGQISLTLGQLTGTAVNMRATGCNGVVWVHFSGQVKETDMVKSGNCPRCVIKSMYVCRIIDQAGYSEIGFSWWDGSKWICAYVDRKGVEHSVVDGNFEALVDYTKGTRNLYWEDTEEGAALPGALVAASNKNGQPLYIAQCTDTSCDPGSVRSGYVVGEGYTMKFACGYRGPQCQPERYLMCRGLVSPITPPFLAG